MSVCDLERVASVKRLHDTSPIWHALAWIGLYVAAVMVGDALSAGVGVANSVTVPALLVLSVALVVYLRANGWLTRYGIRATRPEDFTRSIYYAPLVVIVLLQLTKGFRGELDTPAVVLVVALMAAVGFLEELIFRGLLYRALLTRRGVTGAVVISGVTFGLGHVVNLTRDYTAVQQALQVAVGIGLGIVLALLFALTGSILPLVAFHAVLNVAGSVTARDDRAEVVVVAVTLAICALYAVFLFRQLQRRGDVRAEPELAVGAP